MGNTMVGEGKVWVGWVILGRRGEGMGWVGNTG